MTPERDAKPIRAKGVARDAVAADQLLAAVRQARMTLLMIHFNDNPHADTKGIAKDAADRLTSAIVDASTSLNGRT